MLSPLAGIKSIGPANAGPIPLPYLRHYAALSPAPPPSTAKLAKSPKVRMVRDMMCNASLWRGGPWVLSGGCTPYAVSGGAGIERAQNTVWDGIWDFWKITKGCANTYKYLILLLFNNFEKIIKCVLVNIVGFSKKRHYAQMLNKTLTTYYYLKFTFLKFGVTAVPTCQIILTN